MALKLTNAKDTTASPFVLVWGAAGTGKTVFALTAPKPILVIDVEKKSSEYAHCTVTEHQTSDFTILEYTDPLDLVQQLQEMDEQGYLDGSHFKTIVIDSGTRIWSDIQNDYEEDKKVSGGEDLFAKKTALSEWNQIKGPLRRVMTRIRNTPMVRIVTAHEAQVIDMVTQKVVGLTPKMEKSALYDANIQIRTFVTDNNEFCAEVIRDNTNTFKTGQKIKNPHYGLWGKFYAAGGKNPVTKASIPPAASRKQQPETESMDEPVIDMDSRIAACFADPDIIEMIGIIGLNTEAATSSFKTYKGDIGVIKERLTARIQKMNAQKDQ